MGQTLWQIISVFFLSSVMLVKAGVPAAIGLGFSFFEAVTIITLGGMTGTAVYVYIWDKLITLVKKKRREKKHKDERQKNKTIFTKKNRFIIFLKKRLGLAGIAFFTPLFSYPLGCYIAVRYYQREKQKIFIYMFVMSLLWAVIPFAIKTLLLNK